MVNKQDLLNMDHDDLMSLTCDVLKTLTLKIARESELCIPDGFRITSANDKVIWKFDITVNQEFTEKGTKDFDEFCNSDRIKEAMQKYKDRQLFKAVIHPGDI